ncbi:MAG: hypothetical protein KJO36_06090 [Acidimicrobiia bacterium]|nr:hypothetical protein [Acidimicrobiia bacterium]
MKREAIEWYDSETDCSHPWRSLAETKKELADSDWPGYLVATSVGFVIWENEHAVTITLSLSGSGEVGPTTTIPKVSIVSRKGLRESVRRTSKSGDDLRK